MRALHRDVLHSARRAPTADFGKRRGLGSDAKRGVDSLSEDVSEAVLGVER